MAPSLTLISLKSDDYARRVAASTTGAVRHFIRQTPEFRELRDALNQGELSEATIQRVVNDALRQLKPGEHFEWEYLFSTLAVLLETYSSDFADDFLRQLATCPYIEFGMAPRVAKLCLKQRATSMLQPKVIRANKDVELVKPVPLGLYSVSQNSTRVGRREVKVCSDYAIA